MALLNPELMKAVEAQMKKIRKVVGDEQDEEDPPASKKTSKQPSKRPSSKKKVPGKLKTDTSALLRVFGGVPGPAPAPAAPSALAVMNAPDAPEAPPPPLEAPAPPAIVPPRKASKKREEVAPVAKKSDSRPASKKRAPSKKALVVENKTETVAVADKKKTETVAVADKKQEKKNGKDSKEGMLVAVGPVSVLVKKGKKVVEVPKAALVAPDLPVVSGLLLPCESSEAQQAYRAILMDGYFRTYRVSLGKRQDDLQKLNEFGLVHPVDYEEWTKDLAAFGNQFTDTAQDYCNGERAVAYQRRMARLTRQVLHRYGKFRERVLNSSAYWKRLDRYCGSIDKVACSEGGCSKIQGPCEYNGRRWTPREPSKAALAYVRKIAGFDVENDCVGAEFQFLKQDFPTVNLFENNFLKAYREHYRRILALVEADLMKLYEKGYMRTDDFNDKKNMIQSAKQNVNQNDAKSFNTIEQVIREQRRLSNTVYPLVHEFRQFRHEVLTSSDYRADVAAVCRTKKKNPTRCAQEPACTYDTKGTWFSGPRGCIIKARPSKEPKPPALKTGQDCDD